jgi:DNA-directed RNA polymerase subunit RPC12/RpoP
MPLRLYKCENCGEQFKTKTQEPVHCAGFKSLLQLTAPQISFYEKTDAEKGKSALVGQTKILRERARKHSRDVDMEDLIQNNERQIAQQNGWITKDGTKRKAIDDL